MNTVRIVGGNWRRRVLRFPDSTGLRPSPDRVRETLFNWLGQSLEGWVCLDLFAGSGALGFEAASRGADRVVMVEKAPRVFAALKDNAQLLEAGHKVELLRGDALQYAASTSSRFDLIFLDPPYHCGWIDKLAPFLGRLAGENAALYVETEYPIDSLGSWTTTRRGRAGEVHYHLLQRHPA
ncbi:MAG TPA: 16S rRNA (guanine(966)-N(2))-methyltransferase RsmD [Rhodocyclaceae bacterium]|nr:16S rRNA (guanine(966)-N(2))-methyltransferase RsmD [Rhodocyclaceae bacterium]HMV22003.1 16S rRNA (guanine(966)-N(2))-methyltransferase RsmD [Rhodocyclaceae bacterium]HMW76863.1 16S rRNA (guanine(966)-N(2))-methyltransferase RsmD [Rhodocyclaceae bacterium]HNE43346.1 16S rRNA (guanine(966)-N(2))-methyltransferase RsmD [Rhodocyclaceae bacterium]HNM22992.1 16S rRNA (guanine(966)-N(2))-methyltransferase RsmD [Rhodocyclaceae bacterium]